MTTDDAELERLRALVGPSEAGYEQLLADLEAASSLARESEVAAGELRGRLAELLVQLARARQDQDRMQRRHEMSAPAYSADLAGELWTAVLRPRSVRWARALGWHRSAR